MKAKLYEGSRCAIDWHGGTNHAADAAEAILQLYERGKADADSVSTIKAQHAQDGERLRQFMATVIRSNEPSLLPDECKENLGALSSFECADADGTVTPLLNATHLEACP